jgi:hypothetical protein
MNATIVPLEAVVDVAAFWTCGCLWKDARGRVTHTKAIPRAVDDCHRCGVTREQIDRADAALREDGQL